MTDFSEFQLKEYDNISQAHFKTNEMMVAFYRYYLLIMALPVTLLGTAFVSAEAKNRAILLSEWNIPISIFLISIGSLGILMMVYLTSLRLEAVLYARAVNGVRKYFVEQSKKEVVHVLPIDVNKPKFAKFGDQLFLVLSFLIFNTMYLSMGVASSLVEVSIDNGIIETTWPGLSCALIIAAIISLSLHLGLYHWRCKKMEKSWGTPFVSRP